MRITAEYLHKKWNSISFHNGGYLRVEVRHQLEWYVGYQGIDQKTLLMVSEKEPELLSSSKSIAVNKGLRNDNRWALSFNLMRKEQTSVFETLCADIIVFSNSSDSVQSALNLVCKRFKQWSKLLAHQQSALMDDGRRKGLLGELLFLQERSNNGYPVLSSVQGWVGPDGSDQDFVYSDGWYEIKSAGISAESVVISSLEQLSKDDYGELVIMRIDKCAPQQAGAVALSTLVHDVSELVSGDSEAQMLLENKLSRYGYIDLPEYQEQRYLFSRKDRFGVNIDFPRLTSNTVPSQIISSQYSISLAGIEAWRLEN